MQRQCDVLVIGAGPAGTVAAIAAARAGAKTVLIERFGAAGGAFSMGLALTPVGYEPFKYWTNDTDPDGWAVQGIARRFYDLMLAEEAVVKPVWDVETYKWVCDRLLAEAGVHVVFHSRFVAPKMAGNRVVGATIATAAGPIVIHAGVTIDASGDGDVAAGAGAAFDVGREKDGRSQPMLMATIFGNVNLYDDSMSYREMMAHSQKIVTPIVKRARDAGEIPPVFTGIMFPRVVRGGVLRDQVWVRMVQYWGDPSDPTDISAAESACRNDVFKLHDWLRQSVPGFANCALLSTGARVWPRETRRIVGVTQLREGDVRNNQRYEDGIARGTCFLEAHSATPGNSGAEDGLEWSSQRSLINDDVDYDIRYGCLVPQQVEGLLVAGRCLSADHNAHGSARMQATAMALGEAAGEAAAVCTTDAMRPRDINVDDLRQRLVDGGARV
jgi:hypothetical protein